MKLIKGLLLGSAAGLAVTGAQAADLPVKAKPVEYVRVCSLYGAGFFYIPGTDTCIRIGGDVRVTYPIMSSASITPSIAVGDGLATDTRDKNYWIVRARTYINTDVRTQTAYGTLRAYARIRFQVIDGAGNAPTALTTTMESGLIQWAGFTFGRNQTSFAYNPWQYAYKYYTNGGSATSDIPTGRQVLAYTYQWGNGVSSTIALEDPKDISKRGNYNAANPISLPGITPPTLDTRGGNTWPDVVANIRVDQAWGGLMLAGTITNNHVAYNCGGGTGTGVVGCSEVAGHPSDKIGYAFTGAMKINVPWGPGDAFYIGGSWGKGATHYGLSSLTNGSAAAVYRDRGQAGFGNYASMQFAYVWDTVYSSTTRVDPRTGVLIGPVGQQLSTTYGVNGAFEHFWSPEWKTSIFGNVSYLNYNDTANALLCSRFASAGPEGRLSNAALGGGCNFDGRLLEGGTRTVWTPVKDFEIGAEFYWQQVHTKNGGAVYTQTVINAFTPAANYALKDQNTFGGAFEVRRSF
jgi:hypothetical protein